MIPDPTFAYAMLTEQRVRDAARARALDRPDLFYRDPDRASLAVVRAVFRRIARAVMPRERTIPAAPDHQPSAA